MAMKVLPDCWNSKKKHSYQVKQTESFRGKIYTRLQCQFCPNYLLVERGWFQTPRPEWAQTQGEPNA